MKKIFSIALVAIMMLSLATTAFATNLDWSNEVEISAIVTPATAKAGDTVTVNFYVKDVNATDGIVTLSNGGTIGWDTMFNNTVLTKSSWSAGYSLATSGFGLKTENDIYVIVEPTSTLDVEDDVAIVSLVFTVNDVEAGTYDLISELVAPYVGDGDGNEPGSLSADLTGAKLTIEEDAPATPAEPTYATENESYDDVVAGDTTYTNVYVGEYSATPVAGVGISKIGLKTPAGAEIVSKNVTIEGGAKVTFKAAILGVVDAFTAENAPVVFSEYAFAD